MPGEPQDLRPYFEATNPTPKLRKKGPIMREAMQAIAERRPGRAKLVYDKKTRTIVAVPNGRVARFIWRIGRCLTPHRS